MQIDRLSIQGFRGFLDRRDLPLAAGKRALSLCIFGDNGCGKSSVGDAVEFFFRPDGILARLKKSQTENNAGISATRHALAAQKGIRTEVFFHFNDGRAFARTTNASGAASVIPDEIRELLEGAPVPLLMRSHEMKTFVADELGAKRYEILSRWVGLERLVAIQDALTKIEGKAKRWDKGSSAKVAQDQALDKLTERVVRSWSVPAVGKWLNEKLAAAGTTLKATRLGDLERIEGEICALQQDEEDRSGVSRYETVGDLLDRLAGDDSPIAQTIASSAKRVIAVRELEATRKRLTASELRPVWSAARDYLTKSNAPACPVCSREFDDANSREKVLERLTRSLAAISALEEAEAQVRTVQSEVVRHTQTLLQQLTRLEEALQSCKDPSLNDSIEAISNVRGVLGRLDDASLNAAAWDAAVGSAARELIETAPPARARCSGEAQRLRSRLSIPYADLRLIVTQLITIREGWNRADREEHALVEVTAQLQAVAEAIRSDVRAHVKQVLTALEDDVRAIYGALRGNDEHIPIVDIVVAEDKKSMRVAMSLFGVSGVPPSGYLSDSQLNSLGLALYLAAVRRFNTGLRFILLDDIMSSYDASHRLALVQVLAQYLGDFQVIITTHDQAFFREIKSVLASNGNWQFMQLKPWHLETGVRIEADCDADADVERRFRDGEKPEVVAQLIMGSVEDWLLKICCDRGVEVPMKIRKDRSPAEPTMGTLWSVGQSVFEASHRKHASYSILRGHSVLNWPRHAATAAQLQISLGDLQTFWTHFKTFRDDFAAGARSSAP